MISLWSATRLGAAGIVSKQSEGGREHGMCAVAVDKELLEKESESTLFLHWWRTEIAD
jgi:hypothetical protein